MRPGIDGKLHLARKIEGKAEGLREPGVRQWSGGRGGAVSIRAASVLSVRTLLQETGPTAPTRLQREGHRSERVRGREGRQRIVHHGVKLRLRRRGGGGRRRLQRWVRDKPIPGAAAVRGVLDLPLLKV